MNKIEPFYSDSELKEYIKNRIIDPNEELINRLYMEKDNIFKRKNEETKKSEGRIQSECFEWFNNSFPHLRGLLYHVPNGELRDPITAGKLKAMGVVAGVPDLVFHYRSRTYFIEMKKPGEKPSDEQIKIHKQLDLQSFVVWLCESLNDFKNIINTVLNDSDGKITHGMKKEDFIYRHNIFLYLYGIDHENIISIDDLASKETRKKFMYYVTEFIVDGFDKHEGFELLFTDDYKGIYKRKLDA